MRSKVHSERDFGSSLTPVPPAPAADAGEFLRQMLDVPFAKPASKTVEIVTGHLHGLDDEGRLLFVAEHGDGSAIPVAIGVALSDGVLVPAARQHQRALVVKSTDLPEQWILIGLVRERISTAAREATGGQLEVKLDGETVRLTAENEIELRCGEASLVLRQSGRIIVNGTHVVTSSAGPVKIKGATVAIN